MNQNPKIKAMFQIPEKLRDSLALNHYDEFQKKDEKAARNNMIVIEGRYGSFCYGFDAGYQAATDRLLPLLQKAIEALEFYKDIKPFPDDGNKAIEFLASLENISSKV